MQCFVATGAPLAVSLPHFFRAHEDYLSEVTGLYPQQARHETTLHFEPVSIVCILLAEAILEYHMKRRVVETGVS
jgi:hypothetical protein